MTEQNPMSDQSRHNSRTLGVLAVVTLAMLGLGFASKPLYDTFCRVTGYGGTTQTADSNTNEAVDRVMEVRFDSNVTHELPWTFKPDKLSMTVQVGANNLTFYKVTNLADYPVIATSNYNLTPIKAAPYFTKLECFCFTEQRLEPGESAELPVVFYLDNQLLDDRRMDDVKTVTLSYTFFPVPPAG